MPSPTFSMYMCAYFKKKNSIGTCRSDEGVWELKRALGAHQSHPTRTRVDRNLPPAYRKGTAAPGETQLFQSLPELFGLALPLRLLLRTHETLES